MGRAVTGPLAGTPLRLLPSMQTTWAAWKAKHPNTLVLSFQTGHERDYFRDPYADALMDRSLALVVRFEGETKIYPFRELKKLRAPLQEEIAGRKFTIEFDASQQEATAWSTERTAVPSFVAFLADVRAFYPRAPIFKAHAAARPARVQ